MDMMPPPQGIDHGTLTQLFMVFILYMSVFYYMVQRSESQIMLPTTVRH